MSLPQALSDTELAAYRGYFWKQDTSGDGRLNLVEFERFMLSMGMKLNRHEIRKAFNAADVDNSGEITFIEFANTFLNKGKDREASFSPCRLLQVFRSVDKDSDGLLTREECMNALKMLRMKMNDTGVTRLMGIMDKDRDGGISFQEFKSFFGN